MNPGLLFVNRYATGFRFNFLLHGGLFRDIFMGKVRKKTVREILKYFPQIKIIWNVGLLRRGEREKGLGIVSNKGE